MNDLEELKYGINHGCNHLLSSQIIETAIEYEVGHSKFIDAIEKYYHEFDMQQAFDTYVFCLTEHQRTDTDGRLSMWRG